MAPRKNHAALLTLWLSGKYQSLPQMVKGLKGTENEVSLKLLRSMSVKNKWMLKRAQNAPKLEAMISAKVMARDSTRIAKLTSELIGLEELLLLKIKQPLMGKKSKLTKEEAIKSVRALIDIHRVIDPRMQRRPEDEAPTGESPAAQALAGAQANVTVNIHGQPSLAPGDIKKADDEDLEQAIRDGKAIIYDERPAKPKALKPARKKGNKT